MGPPLRLLTFLRVHNILQCFIGEADALLRITFSLCFLCLNSRVTDLPEQWLPQGAGCGFVIGQFLQIDGAQIFGCKNRSCDQARQNK